MDKRPSCEECDRIGYALAKQVPAMERGFTIQTSYGDLVIDAEDAGRFAALTRELLQDRLTGRVVIADTRQPIDADAVDRAVIALDRIHALAAVFSIEETAGHFGTLDVAEQVAIFGAFESLASAARDALASAASSAQAGASHD